MVDGNIYAVLTGDIVGSMELNDGRGYPISDIITAVEGLIYDSFKKTIWAEIDVFRGDSWQMVVKDPIQSLRIALFIRMVLRSEKSIEALDTRISIGFGGIEFLPKDDISSGIGEAFRLSGYGLDQCKKDQRMKLSFPEANRSSLTEGLERITQLIDFQIQRWTSRQADAVAGALIGLTQKEIAARWVGEVVSQQAISQHLASAGWIPISRTIQYFESILPEILIL